MEFTPPTPKARHGSPLVIYVIAGLAVVAIFLRISTMMTVSANSGDIALAESTYPQIVGSRIDTCALCHTNVPTLNPFGAAYKAGGRGLASSLHAIESADSDGDGWTNLQEINALTFPGNASDHPMAATATMMPPTATRVPPTATSTSVPPTATSVPPTATRVPPTATSLPPTATRVPPTATSVPPTATVGPTNPPANTATPRPTTTGEPRKTRQPRATRTPSGTPTPCIWGDDGEREHEGGSATYSWYLGSYFHGCREWDDVTTNQFYTWDHRLTRDQFAALFGSTWHHDD